MWYENRAGDKNSTHPLVITSEILERKSKSYQSTRPVGRVIWEELLKEVLLHITPLCSFIAYTFKGQVHVFAGQVKIESHSSCRISAILKYFCPLQGVPIYCPLN